MSKITKWALFGTGVWLLAMLVAITAFWDSFKVMPPNEWGDFLAGTVSPLALFWLVIGYIRQGEELRLNTQEIKLQREALILQQQELAEQVKATLQVATHTEQQAAASVAMVEASKAEAREREIEKIWQIQPHFEIITTGSAVNDDPVYLLKNSRGDAKLVKISSDSHSDGPHEFDIVSTKSSPSFSFHHLLPGKNGKKFIVSVRYSDIQGYIKEQRFMIKDNAVFKDGWDHIGDHRNEL